MKNCTKCTRWRPLIDFHYVVYRRGQYGERMYIRGECYLCERKRKTFAAAARRDDFEREREKLAAERKRRANGVPPKEFTGLKDRNSQQRESKRKARRKAGVPVRAIGKHNKGRYGGQDLK